MTEPLDELLAARKSTHGHFSDHARIVQGLKAVIRRETRYAGLTATQRESIDMILHKIGRVIAGDASFPDHWDDIAGYAKIANYVEPTA